MSGYTSVMLPPFTQAQAQAQAYHHQHPHPPPLYSPSSLQPAQHQQLHPLPPSRLSHAPLPSPHPRPQSFSASSALPVAPPSIPHPPHSASNSAPSNLSATLLASASANASSSSSSSATSSSSPSAPLLLPLASLQSLLSSAAAAVDAAPSSLTAVCARYFASCRTRELASHRKAVRCVRWSPSGTKLASCALDGSIRVHSLNSLHGHSANSDGLSAASTAPSPDSAVELRGHSGSVEAIAWSRAQPWLLASASLDRTVRLWDTDDNDGEGRCLETLTCAGELISVAWSADGRFIAAGSKANVVHLIDVGRQRSRVIAALSFQTEINELAFAMHTHTALAVHSASPPSHLLVLSTGKGAVELLDVGRVKEQATLDAAAAPPAPPAAGRASAPSFPTVAPPPPLCSLDNHSATVYCLDVSADGRLLASGGADAAVCVRDSRHFTPVHILARADAAVRSVSFSHAQLGLLALGAEDGLVEISRLTADGGSERVWSTQLSAETSSVAFHPTHPLLAYATDSTAKCTVTLFGLT